MLSSAFNALFALAFVIALLVLFAWLIKRSGLLPGEPAGLKKDQKTLKIKETKALDARNRLIVANWNGKDYLLAAGANGVNAIDHMHAAQETVPNKPTETSPAHAAQVGEHAND